MALLAVRSSAFLERRQTDPATLPPQPGDYFVHATGDDKKPLTPANFELGGRPFQAWPVDPATDTVRDGTLYNLVILSRWDPNELSDEAKAFAADGVVCQTVICNHASCEVSEWIADSQGHRVSLPLLAVRPEG